MAAAPTTITTCTKNATNLSNITTNTLLSNSRRLLMKNQLHLNLNVTETLNVDSDDNKSDSMETATSRIELKWDGVNVETVTTVPQQQLQPHERKQQPFRREYSKVDAVGQSSTIVTPVKGEVEAAAARVAVTSLSSPPSVLSSSSTVLAKFNRIIDSTMPATNYYQQHQLPEQQAHDNMQLAVRTSLAPLAPLSDALQQRLALVHPGIVATDSQTKKNNFTTAVGTVAAATAKTSAATAHAAKPKAKLKGKFGASLDRLRSARAEKAAELQAANVVAAAAVIAPSHDDNQMKRNDVHYLLKQLNSFSDIEEIEIVDMEQRQRQLDEQQQLTQQQQQLAQQQQYMGHGVDKTHSPTAQSLVIISPSSLSHKGIRRYASLHQQQCTQYPLDSDVLIDSVEQQQYLLQQFDDYLFQSCHYLETNYFAANYRTAMVESSSHEFRPSTTTGTSAASVSSEQSLELHDTEPPSVICKASPPAPATPPRITVAPEAPTSGVATTSTRGRLFGMQARLTNSGIQTELTATSLTDASLAKSSSSSASSEEQYRRAPFFKCCYTPIDRWREKRSAAHMAAAARKRGGRRASVQAGGVDAAASVGGRGCVSATVGQQQHTRKNGHAV